MADYELEELKRNPEVVKLYEERLGTTRDQWQKWSRGYVVRCPFHNDHNPSMLLDPNNDGVWMYNCRSCDMKGNVVQFVKEFDKISMGAAIKLVREAVKGTWRGRSVQVDHTFKPAAGREEKPKKAIPLTNFQKYVDALQAAPLALAWLKRERGIEPGTALAMRLGFTMDLKSVGVSDKGLEECQAGGWIMFPYIQGDQVMAIKFRSIIKKKFTQFAGMHTTLYNTNDISEVLPVYIVEGELDCAVMKQAGFCTVSVPSATKNIPASWKDFLMQAESRIAAGDGDGVGSDCMDELWRLPESFKLVWPEGYKDANAVFKNLCKCDIDAFRQLVMELTVRARSKPMKGVVDIREAILAETVNALDNPNRFEWPWPEVDQMAINLPGSVITVFASQTGMGKTSFTTQASLHNALKGKPVLNYQCELGEEEMAVIIASILSRADRNKLTAADRRKAADLLRAATYWVGHDSNLNTISPVLDLIEAAVIRLGIKIVVLDHLHFLTANEREEIQAQAAAMNRIKNMARKYGLIFIVVGQPRKANQANKGKPAHLTDAKGSEAFTSDADAVFCLHRALSNANDPQAKDAYVSLTQVTCMKARAKGVGNARADLVFLGNLATFERPSFQKAPDNLPIFSEEPPESVV